MTPQISDLFHGLMGVCFFALVGSLAAFASALALPDKGLLRWIARNGLCSTVVGTFALARSPPTSHHRGF